MWPFQGWAGLVLGLSHGLWMRCCDGRMSWLINCGGCWNQPSLISCPPLLHRPLLRQRSFEKFQGGCTVGGIPPCLETPTLQLSLCRCMWPSQLSAGRLPEQLLHNAQPIAVPGHTIIRRAVTESVSNSSTGLLGGFLYLAVSSLFPGPLLIQPGLYPDSCEWHHLGCLNQPLHLLYGRHRATNSSVGQLSGAPSLAPSPSLMTQLDWRISPHRISVHKCPDGGPWKLGSGGAGVVGSPVNPENKTLTQELEPMLHHEASASASACVVLTQLHAFRGMCASS